MLKTVNPSSGETLKVYEEYTIGEVFEIIRRADKQGYKWRDTTFGLRSQYMLNLAKILRERKTSLAKLMASEMGKILREGEAEIEKCAWACEFYAENTELFLKNEFVATDALKSYVAYRPLGVILAVMPWNFPFWQVFRFAAPTIMAGNTAILKHASNVPGCALAIEQLFTDAGFPSNVFSSLLIGSAKVETVIRHPAVKAVSLTGSTSAGKSLGAVAGSELKKCVLELGGSDPYVILEDADLELAAMVCAKGRLINAGQSCIAAKRFIVVEKIYADFLKLFSAEMGKATFGNPLESSASIGPLARIDLRNELHNQVIESVKAGAEILLGGFVPEKTGAWYPPTILTNVKPGMPAYNDELFGPVASVIKVKDVEEAIHIANDTPFGLGAAVFTGNRVLGSQIAEFQLDAGCCFVNEFVKSDPRLPFGGIKQSGYGRELSAFGIREFVNVKTIVVR